MRTMSTQRRHVHRQQHRKKKTSVLDTMSSMIALRVTVGLL